LFVGDTGFIEQAGDVITSKVTITIIVIQMTTKSCGTTVIIIAWFSTFWETEEGIKRRSDSRTMITLEGFMVHSPESKSNVAVCETRETRRMQNPSQMMIIQIVYPTPFGGIQKCTEWIEDVLCSSDRSPVQL
jgi:hypothetical protein